MADDGLPLQWSWAELGDVVDVTREAVTPNEDPQREFNYLSIENVESNSGQLVNFAPTLGKNIHSAKLAFTSKDVLYSKLRPYLNKVHLPTFDGISATDLIPLRPKKGIAREFIACFLRTQRVVEYASQRMRGIQLPRITVEDLLSVRIPIPPSTEQQRIVVRIEELLHELWMTRQSLQKIPSIMKQFRHSFLSKAFRGELTERDPSDEPAEELVQRLAGELRNIQRSSNSSATNSELEDRSLPALPATWKWTALGRVFQLKSGGTPRRNESAYWNGEIPWVTSGEVAFCEIRQTKETITQLGNANSNAKILPIGTVLMALFGEGKTRGQAAILRIPATANQAIVAILCSQTPIPSEYLYWWLYYRYEQTRQIRGGSNQPNMYLHNVREMPIPIAPIGEIRSIATLIGERFRESTAVESSITIAKAHTDILEQSILAKAFRGELVAQDPNDEPATVLLERIRNEGLNRQRRDDSKPSRWRVS